MHGSVRGNIGVVCNGNPNSKYIVVYNSNGNLFLFYKNEKTIGFKVGDVVRFGILHYENRSMPLEHLDLLTYRDEDNRTPMWWGQFNEKEKLYLNYIFDNKTKDEINIEDFIHNSHKKISDYINKLDIDKIFDTLQIEIYESHTVRLGENDMFSIIKYSKIETEDVYLKSLFPFLGTKYLYHDSYFAPWRIIREEYINSSSEKYKLGLQHEEKASAIKIAKQNYDPFLHHSILFMSEVKDLLKTIEKENNIKLKIEEVWPIDKISNIISKLDDETIIEYVNIINKRQNIIALFDINFYNKYYYEKFDFKVR